MVEAFVMEAHARALEAHARANICAWWRCAGSSSRGELCCAAGGYRAKLAPNAHRLPLRRSSCAQRGERRPSRLHALRMVYLRGGQVQTSRSFVDELLNLPYALYAFVCFFFQTLIDVRRRPPHTPPHYHG